MIAYLRGKVQRAPGAAVSKGEIAPVEVWVEAGGVGYSVKVAPSTAEQASLLDEQTLYVSQSSALYGGETTLYGFLNMEDRALFELLRDLPGVGAKKALEYFEKVNSKSAERFLDAVARGDSKTLSGVYGFSAKTAAKMIAELKDKAAQLSGPAPVRKISKAGGVSAGAWVDGSLWDRARAALIGLGFAVSDSEAALNEAVSKIRVQESQAPDLENLVKGALKELSVR